MSKRLKTASLLAAISVLLVTGPALAAGGLYGHQSAALTGYSSAQALSGGSTSEAVNMGASTAAGYFTRVTLLMTLVWGTSVILNVTAETSWDGTNWFTVSRCTSAVIHNCSARTWQWTPADGTTPDLQWQPNARYVRFTFDDPGTGSGTIIVSVVKGK